MNKKFGAVLLACGLVSLIVIGYTNIGASAKELSRYDNLESKLMGFNERAEKTGISNAKIVDEVYSSNKNDQKKIKSIEEMKGYIKDKDLKNGAKYETKELLTYEQFINKYVNADLDPCISKDRMIYVTVTHYPNGFNHKKGFVKNALITKYYDAETGELLGSGIKSLDKDGNGIKKSRPNPLKQ